MTTPSQLEPLCLKMKHLVAEILDTKKALAAAQEPADIVFLRQRLGALDKKEILLLQQQNRLQGQASGAALDLDANTACLHRCIGCASSLNAGSLWNLLQLGSASSCAISDSLWDVMSKPFMDENFAQHERAQSMPIGGGRTADEVGKWDLKADVLAWLQQDNIEERLKAVSAQTSGHDEPLYGPDIKVDHEEVLYIALHNAVYGPVNQAAKHLNLGLMYCKPHGKQGLAKSDLRAMDPQTQRTHIPHEVKAPWAEGHVGHHFAELLQDKRSKKSFARPAAQLLYYMVEEGARYGILSSKRHHTFVRRPADPASRQADFSETFDCEQQTAPSVRLLYLYLLSLAQGSAILDPRLRPATAPELKWLPVSLKRKRSQHVSDDAGHSSGSDDEGDGDGLRRLPHGSAQSEHTGTDDADTDESEGTTENDGPSAHTRRHDKTSCAQGLVMLSHRFGKRNNEVAAALTTEYSEWLQTLPLIPRPLLDLHAIQLGRDCVVRSGQWQSQSAIFKLWDLGDSLDPIGQMRAEVTTYKYLSALQGIYIPNFLAHGAFHRGLVAFIATSSGGDSMSHTTLQGRPELAGAMVQSLTAVHNLGVVHGDVALHNFVISPHGHYVWLLDFEHSHLGSCEEQTLEMEHLEELLSLTGVGENE